MYQNTAKKSTPGWVSIASKANAVHIDVSQVDRNSESMNPIGSSATPVVITPLENHNGRR